MGNNKTLSERIVDSYHTGKSDPVELESLEAITAGDTIAAGTPVANITDPTGGTTTDAEARAAIGSILDALEAFGIVLPA